MTFATNAPQICARQNAEAPCVRDGLFTCTNCKLVLYCGRDCQAAHWREHKIECKSRLSKATWLPDWDRYDRTPAWASLDASQNLHNPFGANKYLWGNMPAIDILILSGNEGHSYDGDVSILFAASGDLRNVVRTVNKLPEDLNSRVTATVNDLEFDVVARNAVLLLFAFASMDDSQPTSPSFSISETLIHIWYSAFVPRSLLVSLESTVKPLLKDGWTRAIQREDGTIAKTWTFCNRGSVQISLSQEDWLRLQNLLEVPDGLTFESATRLRASVAMAPERSDYRDRWDYKEVNPHIRLAKKRFREDGLLLPFGHPRAAYRVPNPTLFQKSRCWSLDDKADPLTGWPLLEVNRTPWKAANDCYGKLFVYLRNTLSKFLSRLATTEIHFELFNVNAKVLPLMLEPQAYARIEVSNISDVAYVGTYNTLALLSPLLQSEEQNPHATLITSYINAVMEIASMSGESNVLPNAQFLKDYLPDGLNLSSMLRQGAGLYKVWDARSIAFDRDRYFKRYMEMQNFYKAAKNAKVTIKGKNTIVDPWPLKLKLRPGQVGAQEEFNLLLASNSSGVERYVEWKRESHL